MKKGLLSLLAVALTVVGCQNYDDQFDELSDQITALSQTVQGLSTVADQITALQNTVNGLELTLGGDISNIKTAVEALQTSLADVATAADLGLISSTLADVQADVKELLAANAVINQDITINNVATLEYVESLISTDPDDPNVIVNGKITIEVDDTDFDDEHLGRILAVTNKFATGLKTVTISHTYSPTSVGPGPILTFDNLAFVDNDLSISGSTTLGDGDATNDKLRTVSGNLTIENISGGLDLSLLTSAFDITIPDDVSFLKMGAVNANTLSTAGETAGQLNLTKATIVDGGKSSVSSVVAPKATDIDITAAATLTVIAALADTIDIDGTTLAGDLSVTGTSSGTTVVKAVKVKSVGGTITTGNLAELHLTALTSVNTMSTGAKVMDLSALATQGASAPGGIIATKILNFNAPKLDVSQTVSIVAATDITIKDFSNAGADANSLIYALAAKNLTISALARTNSFTFSKAAFAFPALVNADVTGVAATSSPFITTQTNGVSITSAVLTDLTVGGTVDKVYAEKMAKLANLTTSGYIRNFTLGNAAVITSLSLGHDHIEGSDAALLHIFDAAKLTTVAPTSLDEVGTVSLTALPKMTSLDLSSMKTLPILGEYNITISVTGLTGSYAIGTLVSTTTPEFGDAIYSDDLMTLSPLMKLAAATTAVTYTFNGDIITNVSTTTYDNNGAANAVVSTNGTTTLGHILEGYSQYINTASNIATPVGEAAFVESTVGSPSTASVRAE